MHEDVADSKQAEGEVKKSDALLKAVVEGTPDAVFVKDVRGKYLLANKRVLETFARPLEEVIGKDDSELFGEETARALMQGDREIIATGQTQTFEECTPTKDGAITWLTTKAPWRDSEGNVIGVLGVARDITEHKIAEGHREALLHDMGERNKELTCIYNVAKSIRDRKTIAEILQDVADCIPPGWHYPDITRGKVRFGNHEFVSEPFEETEWKQMADIVVNGKCCGSIEVYYLQECPELDDGPFMAEERNLINGMARAVSEGIARKEAEQQIENLAKFPSENPNPVLRIARDGMLLYANEASESLLKEWNCQTGQAVGECWRHRGAEAFESGSEKRVETEHAGRTYSFAIAPVGEAGYANLYGRDITERKEAEEELLRYASIAASSSDMMAALDANFVYLAANQAYLAAFDLTADEVVGHTVSEVFGEEFFETIIRPNAEHCLEGNKISYDNWFQFPVHGFRYMLVNYSPYIGRDGEIKGFVVNAKDITDRERIEQERNRLLKAVAAKNKELQDIIYIASHDLKSPLVNILGFSGELLKDLERLESLLEKETHEPSDKNAIEDLVHNEIPQDVRFITTAGRMLKGLINGMLQVSRIGSAECSIVPLRMNELVQQVVGSLDFSIRDCGASVTVEELCDCLGDVSKTSQLFGNLINNALKYLEPGRKGAIRIWGRCEDGRSEYCIQDNGIGIDANHQAKVFEIFHRLNPSDDVGGEGLGLTIAVRILNQMDGSIRLVSEPGKGSKFFVSLPSA